ncbi:hypothetical protein PMAYCL1PPCAC_25595, partial [Pristionchus mayeri]
GVSLPSRRSESSIDAIDESTTADPMKSDEDRSSGEMAPPSLSALTPFDGNETEDLCQTTGLLSIVDIRKTEKSLENGSK